MASLMVRRPRWRRPSIRVSVGLLIVVVLVLGAALGSALRARLRDAEAAYRNARAARQLAETALTEYDLGVYTAELDTSRGEVALAEAELKRAQDRIIWADRMFQKGAISKAQHIADKVTLQQKVFAFEQAKTKLAVLQNYTRPKTLATLRAEVAKARAEEQTRKAVYDRARAIGLALAW
jgi:hypothetical protein